MAKFLNYGPCPKCREKGNDNAGDNLAHYSDGGAHCFSCSMHIFPKHYIKPQEKEILNVSALLPTDFSRSVPSRGWEWLLQWGLPYKYWEDRVGWSEKDSRLVFTEEKFSIGRYIPLAVSSPGSGAVGAASRQPRKWHVYGNCHKTPIVLGHYEAATQVVLVEDMLSAHKIAASGAPVATLCLYGTRVFDSVYPCLRHIGLPTCLWLDKDQEAYMPKKAAQVAQLTGRSCRYVVTNEDPKALSFEKIKEILNG